MKKDFIYPTIVIVVTTGLAALTQSIFQFDLSGIAKDYPKETIVVCLLSGFAAGFISYEIAATIKNKKLRKLKEAINAAITDRNIYKGSLQELQDVDIEIHGLRAIIDRRKEQKKGRVVS